MKLGGITMNDKNMSILLTNYKEHLKVMNDSLHDEVYKWDAVRYFQDNWDVDEDNFGAMFENAVSLAGNIINNTNHPAEGIIELAKYEDDTVRSLFRDLFAEDGGDLKVRDDKIQEFIDKSEELRKQYATDNWRYAQDYRSVLAYLSLYSPDENYLYHPTAVQRMVECIEVGKEVGNGKNFSLTKYYKLCDEIKEAIEATNDVVKAHDEYLRDSAYPDPFHHILTYDFISCVEAYQLYHNVTISKRSSRGSSKEADAHTLKIEQMESECHELAQKIKLLSREIQLLFNYSIQGTWVTHKKFGKGKITEQVGNHLTVEFNGTVKTFLLPEAFSNHFLTSEEPEVFENYAALAIKIKEEKKLKNQLTLAEYTLELQR